MHTIEIVSDVSCPWCVIGYRALQAAMNELELQDHVVIRWKPFELNPDMPTEGQDRAEHIMLKYGISQAQAEQNRAALVERGRQEGYEFKFVEDGRVYNTFDAHQLIHWACESGKQTDLKLALFDLYFQCNGNPSDRDQLLEVVEAVGLDVARAREILMSQEFAGSVRTDEDWNHQNGITAVPTFIVNQQFMVSGGQPKETFIKMLQHMQNNAV